MCVRKRARERKNTVRWLNLETRCHGKFPPPLCLLQGIEDGQYFLSFPLEVLQQWWMRAALLNPCRAFTQTNTLNIQTHHVQDTLLTDSLDLVFDLYLQKLCKDTDEGRRLVTYWIWCMKKTLNAWMWNRFHYYLQHQTSTFSLFSNTGCSVYGWEQFNLK